MKVRSIFKVLGSIAILAISPSLVSQTKDKPTESEHRTGPHGLEGWTLESPLPDSNYGDERFAFTLVLARNGHRLRRIEGDPIIWKWMFWGLTVGRWHMRPGPCTLECRVFSPTRKPDASWKYWTAIINCPRMFRRGLLH